MYSQPGSNDSLCYYTILYDFILFFDVYYDYNIKLV